MDADRKRVLLFNAKREKCDAVSPHLGLAMLSGVLIKRGHEVLVADYQFTHDAPRPREFVADFRPDIVGVTLYTATMKEADRIIGEVSESDLPIMVGGPHATLYHEELAKDTRLDYIVTGEAEDVIVELVEGAERQEVPMLVRASPPDPKLLPFPEFPFYGRETMTIYPMQTSRGCPHGCSFCAVHLVSTRRWRPREPEVCVSELVRARTAFPNLMSVIVFDDNPTVRKDHMKQFLEGYLREKLDLMLTVINTRADGLDEEIVSMLRKAKCPSIGLGVESGCREVFAKVGKGETLEEIRAAAELVKRHGMPLSLCFVIGLEGDSLERTKDSIALAKEVRPNHIFWNLITPFKGTRIREWYDANGRVFDVINHSSYVDGDFVCDEPCAESPDFTVQDRKKAYLMAILETNDNRLKLRHIPRLLPQVREHHLFVAFLKWVPRQMVKDLRGLGSLGRRTLVVLQQEGFGPTARKAVQYLQPRRGLHRQPDRGA
ncbi:MAG: B12-binding domain-containing radical SAM protein [Candidatus Thermoplasmatota archaeon]|nr:B12-binding domain-containing radical SAM protein [Candidatus Thermoplasmatota archaeon]